MALKKLSSQNILRKLSDAFLEVEKEAQTLNTGMTGLGAPPLKAAKISTSSKVSYMKRKRKKVEEVITEKVATALGINEEELHPEATNVCMKHSNHEDLNKLVCSLKKDVKVSLPLEKVQLLILARKAGPSIE